MYVFLDSYMSGAASISDKTMTAMGLYVGKLTDWFLDGRTDVFVDVKFDRADYAQY